eukprot:UN16297
MRYWHPYSIGIVTLILSIPVIAIIFGSVYIDDSCQNNGNSFIKASSWLIISGVYIFLLKLYFLVDVCPTDISNALARNFSLNVRLAIFYISVILGFVWWIIGWVVLGQNDNCEERALVDVILTFQILIAGEFTVDR